jgi:hypothetical protein
MENNAIESILHQLQQQMHSISLRLQRAENNNGNMESSNNRNQRSTNTAYVDRNNNVNRRSTTGFYNRDRENGEHDPTLQNDSFHRDRFNTDRPTYSTPNRSTNIIQSVVAVDARTSGIQLTLTTFGAVYKFSKALKKEQEFSRYETLQFSSYISDDVRNYMEAYNREKHVLSQRTTSILNSGIFEISNSEVMHLLMKIALPKSSQQFVANLKSAIPSKLLQLPPNIQVDTNHWQPIYKLILSYVKEFLDILALLQSDESQDYSPPLYASPPAQHPGVIQIFYGLLPSNIGLNVHREMNLAQVKELTNFSAYVEMFLAVSAGFNDLSISFDINKNVLIQTHYWIHRENSIR